MRESRGFDPRLFVLAAGAGVVDVISLTVLGAFTAAVTADLVFIGIAIEDGDIHTAARAALAVVAFGTGAYAAMRFVAGAREERRRSRGATVLAGIAVLQTAFFALWLATSGEPEGVELDVLALLSACAMGGQTAATRRWHTSVVTTYVSGTLVGLIGMIASPDADDPEWRNQAAVIVAVVAGALLGAVLLAHARDSVPLLPVALTLLVAIASLVRARPRRAT
jgi:uncharacterized membrane protein YoaK (UPF0700 family)